MPVRKVDASEIFGGKALVMSARPALKIGFAKLRAQREREHAAQSRDVRPEEAPSDESDELPGD